MEKEDPIKRVYNQYKHLDILLSNPDWMLEPGYPMAPQRKCLLDCWQAIKQSQEGKKEPLCSCRNHPRYGVERDDECSLHGDRKAE